MISFKSTINFQLKRRKLNLVVSRRLRTDLFSTSLLNFYNFKLKNTVLKDFNKTERFYLRNLLSCSPAAYRRFYKHLTAYGSYLFEKQRLRSFYGEFKERWFCKTIVKYGPEKFLAMSESRLDVILLRSGLFKSQSQIRLCIRHGFVYVNNQVVNKCRFFVPTGSEVSFDPIFYITLIKNTNNVTTNSIFTLPCFSGTYLEFSPSLGKIIFYRYPQENEIFYPFRLNLYKVLNYYTHSLRF
jgi:ribosomal protein S4